MIRKIAVFHGTSNDPWQNLAVEEALLGRVSSGEIILYLWQNAHTVVIGRNQNPWKECRVSLLEQEGGRLARRLSGGGAVYHDLGNLNFTFLLRQEDYDVPRQLEAVASACRELGVPAAFSGRNDLLADGRKFSGNAFYRHEGKCYHHGTLMVDVDMARVDRYLSPSKAKLQAKGVDSVRSRVVNLRELVPSLTCGTLAEAMVSALERTYGGKAERISPEELDASRVEALRARNESWDWRFGRELPLTFTCEKRFSWGEIQLCLRTEAGVVREAKVFSDAMDWDLAPLAERALTGARFCGRELTERLAAAPLENRVRQDLIGLLEEQEI